MRSRLQGFSASLAAIMSGMTFSSLLITHTDNWKTYLSIALVCLAFNNYMREK